MKRGAFLLSAMGAGLFFVYRNSLAIARPGSPGVGVFIDSFAETDELELISMTPNKPQQQVFAWENLRHFQRSEFNHPIDGDVSGLMDLSIVLALDELRARVGCPIIISPASGSLVRFDFGSQHDISGGRLSRASDIFVPGCTMREVFNAAKSIPAIGGVGLYPDWKPRAGYHIDTRPRKADGTIASWMGRRTPSGQTYAGIEWGFLDGLGRIA